MSILCVLDIYDRSLTICTSSFEGLLCTLANKFIVTVIREKVLLKTEATEIKEIVKSSLKC